MNKFTCFCLYLGNLLIFSSCAPSYLTRLQPYQQPAAFTENNIQYTKIQQDSLELIVGHVKTEGEYLVMDVEIGNFSEDSLVFDPAECSYIFVDSLTGKPAMMKEEGVEKIIQSYAFDPPQEINRINAKIRQEEANLRAKKAFLTFLAVVGTVATVAVLVENNSSKNRNNRSSYERAVINNNLVNVWSGSMQLLGNAAIDSHARHSFSADNLQALRETWETMPIQEIIIPPKKRIRGDVIFHPRNLNGILKFSFPLEKYNFEVLFRQTVEVR